jgi:hypothetical protein
MHLLFKKSKIDVFLFALLLCNFPHKTPFTIRYNRPAKCDNFMGQIISGYNPPTDNTILTESHNKNT